MDYQRPAECHHINIDVGWDNGLYRSLMRDRWDIWKDEPMQNAAQNAVSTGQSTIQNGANSMQEYFTQILGCINVQ